MGRVIIFSLPAASLGTAVLQDSLKREMLVLFILLINLCVIIFFSSLLLFPCSQYSVSLFISLYFSFSLPLSLIFHLTVNAGAIYFPSIFSPSIAVLTFHFFSPSLFPSFTILFFIYLSLLLFFTFILHYHYLCSFSFLLLLP